MIFNHKIYSIKHKVLLPLFIYLLTFSLIMLTLFNGFFIHTLKTSQEVIVMKNFLLKFNILIIVLVIGFLIGFTFLVFKICNSLSKSILILSQDTKELVNSCYKTDKLKTFCFSEVQELNISINRLAKKLLDYHNSQKIAIANASHDLRTPLMSIQGYAEGIKYNVFDDINEPLDIIIEESINLRDLIKSILTLSELDSRNLEKTYESLNIYTLLNHLANKLRGLAYKSNKTISIYGDKDIYINTDEMLLSQGITNILSNALRYAKQKVIISFQVNNNSILIRIEDDGDGICEEDLDNLFTRFYKGKNGSFGLGLSIAQSSIKYLDGDIVAYNSKEGACFDIHLALE